MDISSWDGTISLAEFHVAACALVEKWKKVSSASPPWSWVSCPKQPWVASHEVSVVNFPFNFSSSVVISFSKKLILLLSFVPLDLLGGRILVTGEHNSRVN